MTREDDIWYAVDVTRVVLPPQQTLETFGATTLRFHLISELMDEAHRVRVRYGKVFAERPQIIAPRHFAEQLLDGFGEKAEEYVRQLEQQGDLGHILRYGLQFRREHAASETIAEPLNSVTEKIKAQVEAEDDPLAAVVVGADELWEVSLLKFLQGYIENSAPQNLRDFHQRNHEAHLEFRREIEMEFQMAAADRSRIQALGQKLQDHGLFEEYEDRFFGLVNTAG